MPEEFKKFFLDFRRAFPDIHITVQETGSEDDLVVAYCRITVTHRGEVFGMQATGKLIAFDEMPKFRVRDGKVVKAWNKFDFLKMLQRMGGFENGGRLKSMASMAPLIQ